MSASGADYWVEELKRARERYRQATADEATETERGTPPRSHRREAIQALIDRGATEGERAAATAAMYRLDHPSEQTHAATERGSYYARDTLAGTSGDD